MMHKLPNQWKRIKLGAIATFSQGIQVGVEKQVTEPQEGFQRFIRIVDYTQIGSNDIRYVPRVSNRYFASKEDIVMIRYGTPGLIGRGIEGVIANNMFKITFKDTVDNNFAEQYLKFPETINEINKGSASSTMPAINFGFLKNLDFIVPPLPEQQKIAEILSTVDEKIEAIDQRIAETQDLKKGLMQQLLTKGIGHTQFKDSPLGEIPESWEVRRIDDIFDFIQTKSFSRAQLSYESGSVYNVHYGDIHSTFKNSLVDLNETELPRILPEMEIRGNIQYLIDGDLILADASEDLEGVGICVEIKNVLDKEVIGGLHTIVLRDRASKTANGYRTYLLSSPLTLPLIKRIATGASVLGVSKGNLKNVDIVLPPIPEQKKIAEILSSVDEKLQIQQDKKAEYQELKKGLMQQLLTGKVRVKTTQD